MPTKHVAAPTMEIGKKGRGKHWTAAEVEARAQAAASLKRDQVVLRPPRWLGKEARRIWDKVLKDAAGLDLFDNLDRDTLAIYCDAVVKYKELSKQAHKDVSDIKALQAWSRIIAQYADKLGLTPAARARLVKKRADGKLDEFGKEFD